MGAINITIHIPEFGGLRLAPAVIEYCRQCAALERLQSLEQSHALVGFLLSICVAWKSSRMNRIDCEPDGKRREHTAFGIQYNSEEDSDSQDSRSSSRQHPARNDAKRI